MDDYWIYGSLENINAFAFESYLGILKNCIRSGYKPLQQMAKHAFSENSMCLFITKFLADVNRSFCDGAGTYQTNVKGLFFPIADVIIKSDYLANSTVCWKSKIYHVVSITKSQGCSYLNCQCYLTTDNLFDPLVASQKIGIYKVCNLGNDIVSIKVTSLVKKCVLLLFKKSLLLANFFIECNKLYDFY